MDTSSRQKDLASNHEPTSLNINKTPRSTNINHFRKWSSPAKFRNPRIVRVSSEHGGKDRHSKVFTVKGLRDRRIRLSVPTAIQLYDLQHRLGLNQPSKVMDWLIEATKHDIDKLPPLQMHLGDHSSLPSLFYSNPTVNDGGLIQHNKFERNEQDLFRTESSTAHYPNLGNCVLLPYPQTWESSNSNTPSLLLGNQGSSFPFTSQGPFLAQPAASSYFLPPYPQFITAYQEENYDTKPFAHSIPFFSSNSHQSAPNPGF